MDATIKRIADRLQNPGPGFEQVINGHTPLARLESLHKEAVTRVRRTQVERHDVVRQRAVDLVDEDTETVEVVLEAVRALKKDLQRGMVEPDEVKQRAAESMRGVEELIEHVRQVERDEEAATAMVDTDPGDYEASLLERFPAQGVPIVTDEFLRGEAGSPFRDGGGS